MAAPTYPDITTGFRGNDDTYAAAGTPGGAVPKDKLWLPIWESEVMQAYDAYNVFETLVQQRNIAPGVTSAQFPITGTLALKAAWRAGEELSGGGMNTTTFEIFIDKRPMAVHFELDKIDLMNSQFEFRQEMARQAGERLASTRDKQVGVFVALAGMSLKMPDDPRTELANGPVFADKRFGALGAAIGTTQVGFTAAITSVDKQNAALLALQAIDEFLVWAQENNISGKQLVLMVTPRGFQDIRTLGVARQVASDDFSAFASRPMFGGVAEAGGLGQALSNGLSNLWDRLEYMGVYIMKTNHLPVTYAAGDSTEIGEARYLGTFAKCGIRGMLFASDCVGSLNVIGMQVDSIEDKRRGSHFTVASTLKGAGILRPECAALLIAPTSDNSHTSTGSGKFFDSNANAYTLYAAVDACWQGGTEGGTARAYLAALAGLTAQATTTQSTTTGMGPGVVNYNGAQA